MNQEPIRYLIKKILPPLLFLIISIVFTLNIQSIVLGGATPVSLQATTPYASAISQSLTTQATPVPPVIDVDYKIVSETSLENGAWVVLKIEFLKQRTDPGVVVLHKEASGYKVVAGPATTFGPDDLTNCPPSVVNQLQTLGVFYAN